MNIELEWDGEAGTVERAERMLAESGIVVVRGGLSPRQRAELRDIVDEWYRRFLDEEVSNYSLDEETATVVPDIWETVLRLPRKVQAFRKWNIAGLDRRFVGVVDRSPFYDIAWRFLGPDLMVTKTQMVVVPPDCAEEPYLHTDAGSLAAVIPARGGTPVMCSAQIFLSDLPVTDMGNFTCVPGSHVEPFPWEKNNTERSQLRGVAQGGGIDSARRTQIVARAGDVAIFTHSLWHGVSRNVSGTARYSLILSYAKSFVRPYDYETTPGPVLEVGTPRQRRLFGVLDGWAWRPGCVYHLPENHYAAVLPDTHR